MYDPLQYRRKTFIQIHLSEGNDFLPSRKSRNDPFQRKRLQFLFFSSVLLVLVFAQKEKFNTRSIVIAAAYQKQSLIDIFVLLDGFW